MTDMIEKMATAHYQNMSNRDLPYSLSWHKLTSNAKNNYMDDMRAAIEALREPDEDMMEAFAEAYHLAIQMAHDEYNARHKHRNSFPEFRSCPAHWIKPALNALIDAALGEQEE